MKNKTMQTSWALKTPYWSQATGVEALIVYMTRARKESNKIEYAKRAEQAIEDMYKTFDSRIIFRISPWQATVFRQLTGSELLNHHEKISTLQGK